MAYVEGIIEAGEVLRDRFQIREVIGKGAYGVVYRADDLAHKGVQWAVKEIWEGHLSEDERTEALQRFRHEVSVLKGLNHTGIPKVVEAFSMGPSHFLVMEYIEGRTAEALSEEHAPDERTVVNWALKICDILEYLHNLEPDPLIYRDIKPGNIMITAKGRVLLIDFGIARFFNPLKQRDTMILGTPGFAPPEQYGRGQSDMRSDIYALGATMYHLLTGSELGAFNFRIPPIRELRGDISSELESTLARCLEIEPHRRFSDVGELKSHLRNEGALAPPSVTPSPQSPYASLHPSSQSPSYHAASLPSSPSAASFAGIRQAQNMIKAVTNIACAGIVLFLLVMVISTIMSFRSASTSPDIWSAVAKNSTREVNSFIRKDRALLNAGDHYGNTPLFYALRWDHPDMAEYLLKRGANVNTPCTADLRSPLFAASEVGCADVAALMIKKGALIDEPTRSGATPLMIAAERGHREVVVLLLDKGANINAHNRQGLTPLLIALSAHQMSMAELLCQRGADVNLRDRFGRTPLMFARYRQQPEMAEFLERHGGL
jgi:serine/threonine protein kinase